MKKITITQAKKVLEVVDAGLVRGLGIPEPGRMCVEAAVCFALGEPHGDEPSCVAESVRRFKVRLNDSQWSSARARALGMRRLAIAQLGSKDHINERKFVRVLAVLTIQRVLSLVLRNAGLDAQARKCEMEGTKNSALEAATAADAADAIYAASYAAIYAADAATDADAATSAALAATSATSAALAADSAAYAADSATSAADAAALAAAADADRSFRDKILTVSAGCCLDALREVNAPGIALLDELGI